MSFHDEVKDLSVEAKQELYSIVYVCYWTTPPGLRMLEHWSETDPKHHDNEFWSPPDVIGIWDREDMADCGRRWSRQIAARQLRKAKPDITSSPTYTADLQIAAESLWRSFLRDFHEFVCSDPPSSKYADLVAKARPGAVKSQLVLASTVASVMAVYIGVKEAMLVAPFVAIGFLALGRFGRIQFCARVSAYLRGECSTFDLTIADIKADIKEQMSRG